MTNINSYFRSDIGQKRTNNEDAAGAFEPKDRRQLSRSGCLYVVADGLGGHQFGEKASAHAVETLLKMYYEVPGIPPEKRLRDVIQLINQNLIAYAQKNVPAGEKVATTVVAAVVRNGTLQVAHVGDSRAYLLRDGELQQITHDHSFVGELMRSGSITEQEAQASPYRNRLMRSLGGKEANVEVDVTPPIPLRPGDLILLCTDGLTQYAGVQDILAAAQHNDARQIVERLIQFANAHGGTDNITVSAVQYGKKSMLASLISWKTLAAVGAGVLMLAMFTLFGLRYGREIVASFHTPTPTSSPTPTSIPTATLTPTIEPTSTPTLTPAEAPIPAGALVTCDYVVQTDDTTSSILITFQTTIDQIFRGLDLLLDPNNIQVGEILTIRGILPDICTAGGGTPRQETNQQGGSPPVIDRIEFPQNITCDGSSNPIQVRFRDPDGDAYQVSWEVTFSQMQVQISLPSLDFSIDALDQINGAVFDDWFAWSVLGDVVRILITIWDRTGLSGSGEFNFSCSN